MNRAMTTCVFIFLIGAAVVGAAAVSRFLPTHSLSAEQQENEYAEKLDEITEDIISGNAAAGFKKVNDFYADSVWFRPRCYEFTLELGAAVYNAQHDPTKLVFGPESAICNYGFYQEYPRVFLLNGGSIAAAVHFCATTGKNIGDRVPDAEAECFRGIGRALPFIQKDLKRDQMTMATYAVVQCKTIAPNTSDYENCLSGLFNKLGRESLPTNTENPLGLCDAFSEDVKTRCIGNYKWALIPLAGITNFAELTTSLSELYPHGISTTTLEAIVWSFGYDTAHLHIGEKSPYRKDIQACEDMPGTLALLCIKGYGVGLAKLGVPNEQHVALIQFCTEARAAMPTLTQDDCPGSAAVEYLKGFYAPQQREAMCREFEAKLGVRCE